MKKTFFAFGVLLAVVCGTLAYASSGQGTSALFGEPMAKASSDESASNPNVGQSIGTVDAQLYSESGLSLSYFNDAEYVAQVSDSTYMGFIIENLNVSDESAETSVDSKYASLRAISASEKSVTVPDNIKIDDEIIPVKRILTCSSFNNGFNNNIKSLTIPSTVTEINNNGGYSYNFTNNLEDIYFLGKMPSTSLNFNNNIYVCKKECYVDYSNNENFTNSLIFPYGWDFDWVIVNVEKTGEFAETYLSQNDYDWDAAQNIKVTGDINEIDMDAIKKLTNLYKLDLSETKITSIPRQFMYHRYTITDVKLPATLTTIEESGFADCKNLKSVEHFGVKEIGRTAFHNCSKLVNFDLSKVVNIGYRAFHYCTSLESIDLSSIVSIDIEGFDYCKNLKSLLFGLNLQSIGENAFLHSGLIDVEIPEGVNEIKNSAFANCSNLKSIKIPSSIATIDGYTFRDCTALVEVSLPDGLRTIKYGAFEGCASLEDITIPSTVTAIESNAFKNTGIKTFRCFATVPPTANDSFFSNNTDMSDTYLYVPPFSKDFYRNTLHWSDFYLMKSLNSPVGYMYIDRAVTINLEEEDNEAVANNPTIDLCYSAYNKVGQLTAVGEGTLSAGQLIISGQLTRRDSYNGSQYMPTLINYADKMRADNVTHNLTFLSNDRGGGRWHFISLPYDVKVSDIVPSDDTYWVIHRYDSAARAAGETSSTWVDLTNDDALEACKGYIVSVIGYDENGRDKNPTLSFTSGNSLTKNNLFRSTDIIVTLNEYAAEFAHNRSWNLIGNPYPCYFDMHYLNEEFTAPITVWNGSSYVAYSPVDDDLVLSPYEAFFVQCPLESTEMTFKEGGRMHSDEGKSLYKAAAQAGEPVSVEGRNVFNFVISGENYEDRARIVLNPEAKAEYEIGRDASKFFADNANNAQIYVSADVTYSINERPVGDGCATLGVRSANEKAYTLSLAGKYSSEWSVMLTDNETGVTVDLTKEPYQFISGDAENTSRFSVKFNIVATSGIDSIKAELGADANITVTGINGVVVYTGSLSEISVPAPGLYLISNGEATRKAILK